MAGDSDQAHNAENILKSHDIEIEINKKATIADKKSAILTFGYSSGFVLQDECGRGCDRYGSLPCYCGDSDPSCAPYQ